MHGGQRKNAGRLPAFGSKKDKKKSIHINVPDKHHSELVKVCKESIKEYLQQVEDYLESL